MASPWDRARKELVAYPPIGHGPPRPRPAGFSPPLTLPQLSFGRLELGLAMARTGAIRNPTQSWLRKRAALAAAEVSDLVDDDTSGFELLPDLRYINGAERTALAGRIGAGICDLLMQSMRYVWRDQASALISAKGPLADFAYTGPALGGHGVALAEAKGSTQSGGRKVTQTLADKAYRRQVGIHLGAATLAGPIVHGYAMGLRAPIGRPGFVCIAQSDIGGGSDVGGGHGDYSDPVGSNEEFILPARGVVHPMMALGNYASLMALIGEDACARALFNLRTGETSCEMAGEALRQVAQQSAGDFVFGRVLGTLSPYAGIRTAVHVAPVLALAEFLVRARPGDLVEQYVELPILRPQAGDEQFVQCPDGLAGFAISREEALQTEAKRPPGLFDGQAETLPVMKQSDVGVSFDVLRTMVRPEMESRLLKLASPERLDALTKLLTREI